MARFLPFLFLFLPFQFALQPTASTDTASIRIVSIGIFFIWALFSLFQRKTFFPVHFIAFFLLSWLFFVTLSLSVATHPTWGLRKLAFLFSFIPLFFVFSDTFKKYPETIEKSLSLFVTGASAAAGIAILQWVLQWIIGINPLIQLLTKHVWPVFLGNSLSTMVAQYPSFLVNIGGHTLFRAVGLFPDPHIAAYYFSMAFPCALTLGFIRNHQRTRWLLLATILLLADLLTFSRGSYIGLALSSSIALGFVTFQRQKSLPGKHLFLLLVCGVFVFLGVLFSPIGSRFLSSFSTFDTSNQGRFAMWLVALDASYTFPWLGVGLGNFPLFVDPTTTYRTPIYAHNLFLDTLAESGWISGAFLFLCLLCTLWTFFTYTKQQPIFFGPFFGLIIFIGHSIFENPLYSVHILPVLCFFLALGVSNPPKVSSV